jgi:hypothetical protein
MATAPTGLPRLQCDCRQGRFPQPALDISVAFPGGLAGVRLVVISRAQPRQEKAHQQVLAARARRGRALGRDRRSDAARRIPTTRGVGAADLDTAQETHRAIGYRNSLSSSRIHGEVATCQVNGAVPVADPLAKTIGARPRAVADHQLPFPCGQACAPSPGSSACASPP